MVEHKIIGLEEAKDLWDDGLKIRAIKSLRQSNPEMDLVEARKTLDFEYASQIKKERELDLFKTERGRIVSFLIESGHQLAPGEPVIEKLKNLVGTIHNYRHILKSVLDMIPEDPNTYTRKGLLELIESVRSYLKPMQKL